MEKQTNFFKIIISSTASVPNEHAILHSLFDEGLFIFHLQKPAFSLEEMEQFLRLIPAIYHSRIVIHSHYSLATKYNLQGIHLCRKDQDDPNIGLTLQKMAGRSISASSHTMAELTNSCCNYHYVLLGPIFESGDKTECVSGFEWDVLKEWMTAMQSRPHPPLIVAQGGIGAANIAMVEDAGFAGAALREDVWESDAPVERFKLLRGYSLKDGTE
jgi:thiamine-phosphate pyrophosphorylase